MTTFFIKSIVHSPKREDLHKDYGKAKFGIFIDVDLRAAGSANDVSKHIRSTVADRFNKKDYPVDYKGVQIIDISFIKKLY